MNIPSQLSLSQVLRLLSHFFVRSWLMDMELLAGPLCTDSMRSVGNNQSVTTSLFRKGKERTIANDRNKQGDCLERSDSNSMKAPERYRDWPAYWPPKSLSLEEVLLTCSWPCFGWRAHQVMDLLAVLKGEIAIVRRPFEAEDDVDGGNDPDARSIARAWASELAQVVKDWCGLLDLDPMRLPGYDRAQREAVSYAWIDPNPMLDTMAGFLAERYRGTDFIFRPLCLERASCELRHWLAKHPNDVDRVHHRTFEAIIAEMIRDSGWTVALTQRTRDGGYDILCLQRDVNGTSVKMVVETKLYDIRRSVGLATVDRLVGAASRDEAQIALVVTNSNFSGDVWKRWEHRVGRDLSLVDREELMRWLSDSREFVTDTEELLRTLP